MKVYYVNERAQALSLMHVVRNVRDNGITGSRVCGLTMHG